MMTVKKVQSSENWSCWCSDIQNTCGNITGCRFCRLQQGVTQRSWESQGFAWGKKWQKKPKIYLRWPEGNREVLPFLWIFNSCPVHLQEGFPELPSYKPWGTHHGVWGRLGARDSYWAHRASVPRYWQAGFVLICIYIATTGTSPWTVRWEQDEAVCSVCICASAECSCLCWSVWPAVYICTYMLYMCALCALCLLGTCSASLLGWTWAWNRGSLAPVTLPDSPCCLARATSGIKLAGKLLLQ